MSQPAPRPGLRKFVISLPLLILLLSPFSCTPPKPIKKAEIPESAALPIDGLWESYPDKERVQIEKGRMFFPEHVIVDNTVKYEAETAVAKNIRQTGPKSYVCEWLLPRGIAAVTSPITFDAPSNTSLVFHIPALPVYQHTIPAQDLIYYRLKGGGPSPASGESAETQRVKVRLDNEVKRVEASSELIEIPPGVVIEIKRSRTIEHTVNLEAKGLVEVKVDADFYVFLRGSIRTQIEATLGKSFKQSETLEHKITLDGNKARQYKLIWYDKIRSGAAEFEVDEKPASVPFTFREWEDLDVIAVGNSKE
jgi:hypothetical protein